MSQLSTFFAQGGPVMYFLAACSVIALAVVLERAFFWYSETRRFNSAEMREFIAGLAQRPVAKINAGTNPLLQRIHTLIRGGNEELVADAIALEINDSEDRALRNLSALSMVIAISPLLGILGTVLGIINSFSVMQEAMLSNPGLVSAGLAEALITTAAGLIITVPCLVILTFLRSLSARHVRRLERFADELDMYLQVSQPPVAAPIAQPATELRKVG